MPTKLSEVTIRRAVDACPSGMVMTDRTGKIVLVNAEVERLFGYSREELLDHSVDMLVPEGARAGHAARRNSFAAWPEARRMGIGRDLYGRRKDGTQFPIEIGLNPIQTDDGLLVLSAITDLTERKAAEERFRRVVENSPIAKMMTDQNGTIMLVNIATERLLGIPARRIDRQIHRDSGAAANSRWSHQFSQGVRRASRIALDGQKPRPLHRPQGRDRAARRDRAQSDPNGGRDDGPERHRRYQRTPGGDPQSCRAREELQRSNADLEQFAYVASHDLQEPLRMVATYTELLAERYQGNLDERADKYIKYAVDGAERMQRLVNDLLAFSRVGSNAKVPIRSRARWSWRPSIRALNGDRGNPARANQRTSLPTVLADEAQIGQVFQNLIGNAIKFRGERPPHIRVGAERAQRKMVCRVKDNGIGIDPQYSDRIFQMFQRLHERGNYEGNGIGLAIAKKIVERHGGRIWFESEPEWAPHFYFTIPSA